MTDVHSVFKRRGWIVQDYEGNADFLRQNFGTQNYVLGAFSLQGKLGQYGPMSLLGLWEFDNNNRLIDILVLRKFDFWGD
jgi:hypothetical protein